MNTGAISGHSQRNSWALREVHQEERSSVWATRLPDESE